MITPSVPSQPMKSWLRSGPTAAAGAPPVRMTVRRRARPRARRPCPRSCRSAWSTGRRRGRRPIRRRSRARSSAGNGRPSGRARSPRRTFEVGPEHPGADLDDAGDRRRPRRVRRARSGRAARRRTPERVAPHTPLRPPAAVTGTPAALQAASTAATCVVSAGRTSTAARCGTCPASAQCSASGHQSRLASATAVDLGHRRADRRRAGRRSRSGASPWRRRHLASLPVSSIGLVGLVTPATLPWWSRRRPRRRTSPGTRRSRARRSFGAPAELAGEQIGDVRRRRVGTPRDRAGGRECAASGRRRASSPSRGARRTPPRRACTAVRAPAARPSDESSAISALTSAASVP